MFIMYNSLGLLDGEKEILAKADTLTELKEILMEKGYIDKKHPKVYDNLYQEIVPWGKIDTDRIINFDIPMPYMWGFWHLTKIK